MKLNTKHLTKLIETEFDLSIGGEIVNKNNLTKIENLDDVKNIPNKCGMYMIFASNADDLIDADLHNPLQTKHIELNGEKLHCIYNGKSNNIKSRVKSHLLRKDRHNESSGIALDSVTDGEFDKLIAAGKIPKKDWYPYFKKSNGRRFLNGINVTDEKWAKHKFFICFIEVENTYREMFELIFRNKNGISPLCKYK